MKLRVELSLALEDRRLFGELIAALRGRPVRPDIVKAVERLNDDLPCSDCGVIRSQHPKVGHHSYVHWTGYRQSSQDSRVSVATETTLLEEQIKERARQAGYNVEDE